jgi:hypothetical protein
MDVMRVDEIHNLCLLSNATWITNDEVQGQSKCLQKINWKPSGKRPLGGTLM